jgi:hypothetical protein
VRIVLAIVLALCAAGGGTVYAAQDSLPGDALYRVKLGTEQVMMWPGDDVAKTERALSFAERRVGEMEALAGTGRSHDLDLAVEKYGYAVSTTVAAMKKARNGGPVAEEVTERIAEAMTEHLPILDTLFDMVPEEANTAMAYARDVSEIGREDALAALATDDAMHAAEMNLAAMDGRLTRVRAKLQDPEALQLALEQFYDMAGFAQDISGIAEEMHVNIFEMAELVTEATSRHLEALAELHEEVSEEAKEAVESAMEESFRGYEDITTVLMGNGAGESELPAIPESIRRQMEDILGWTDAPKARIPTGGPSGWPCPGCRY